MKLGGLSLGLAAALLLGGAARAADFDDFQTFCVAPHGDAKAALAAADAAGWSALPAVLMAQLKQPGMVSADGRMKTDAGAMRFLMVAGQAQVTGPEGPRMDACVLGIAPPSGTGLADQVKAWAAVPENPEMSKNGMHGYVFLNHGGRHEPIPSADMAAVSKNPNVSFVMVQEQPQVSLIVYGVPSTTSPN